ncbi:MAG: hypothetical protein KDK36_17715, partial [Leptospiraceae bacterium]|nr:hypothetical protein [Leptospiraceae bacterium]
MKGKQINFYLLNSEIQEIDNYLLNQEISILGIPMPSTKLNFLNSILEPSPSFMKFLTLKKWGNRIKTRYIEEQNYYLIDIFNSPVIEFSLPFQKEKNI